MIQQTIGPFVCMIIYNMSTLLFVVNTSPKIKHRNTAVTTDRGTTREYGNHAVYL